MMQFQFRLPAKTNQKFDIDSFDHLIGDTLMIGRRSIGVLVSARIMDRGHAALLTIERDDNGHRN